MAVGDGGWGRGLNYFRAHMHRRFMHARHETKDRQPGSSVSRQHGRNYKEANEANASYRNWRFLQVGASIVSLALLGD